MEKKKCALFFILFCGIISQTTDAKKYRILELINCNSIKIGKKILHEQDFFVEKDTIYWKSSLEAMRLESKSGEKRIYARQGFLKYNVTTLEQFLIKEKGLAGRGLHKGTVHYSRQYHCLVDSLHFKANQELDTTLIAEAIWISDGKQMITRIQRTEDNKFYIITPEIFGDQTPLDILLNIRERDEDYEYINNVYSKIPIIYIPRIKQQ